MSQCLENGIFGDFNLSDSNFPKNVMSRSFGSERLLPMKKTAHHLIAEVQRINL